MPFEQTELRKFTTAGRAIRAAANIGVEQWARGESGVIMKLWAGGIHAASPAAAERRGRNKVLKDQGLTQGTVTINSGVRGPEGRVWIRAKNGKYRLAGKVEHNAGAFTPREDIHFSDEQWDSSQKGITGYQARAGLIALARRTIGLARQSVVQIADALGINLAAVIGGGISAAGIAQARTAVASDGNHYVNGTGTQTKTESSFMLELVNTYPKITEAKVDLALISALGARQALAARSLEAGVFKSMEKTARAYPYVEIA